MAFPLQLHFFFSFLKKTELFIFKKILCPSNNLTVYFYWSTNFIGFPTHVPRDFLSFWACYSIAVTSTSETIRSEPMLRSILTFFMKFLWNCILMWRHITRRKWKTNAPQCNQLIEMLNDVYSLVFSRILISAFKCLFSFSCFVRV